MTRLIIFRAMFGALLGSLVLMGAWQQAHGEMQGEVTSVDSRSGMLTLSEGKQLAVDAGTVVRKDGTVVSLGEIKEGDQVRASFSPNIPWLLGQKDSLQDRVKEVDVVATPHPGAM